MEHFIYQLQRIYLCITLFIKLLVSYLYTNFVYQNYVFIQINLIHIATLLFLKCILQIFVFLYMYICLYLTFS